MGIGLKETVTELAKEFGKLYKDLVTNTVQFGELRNYTKETLEKFSRSLERLQDKLESYERDNIKTVSRLESKIDSLSERLSLLSESALHSAAKDAAMMVMEKIIKEENLLKEKDNEKPMLKEED